MTKSSLVCILVALVLCQLGYSQDKNVFLERSFWKRNPSVQLIEEKIAEGNDITQLNSHAFDAICWALIEKTDNKTVKHLLSYNGNGVNKITHDGRTYIFWAAYKGNLEMMNYLIENGARTDIIDSHGYSLLNFAAVTGQTNKELYDFCISNGSEPLKEKNNDGANPLQLVIPFLQNLELVEYFQSFGLDLHSVDDFGNGVFNYASKRGNTELLEQLIQKGVKHNAISKKNENAIIHACRGTRGHANSLESFAYLDSLGIASQITTIEGENPLHILAYKKVDPSVIEFFLNKKIDVNEPDKKGNTPFMNACAYGSLDFIKLMLPFVTDINMVNSDGATALMLATQNNSAESVSFLMENGSNAYLKDNNGNNLGFYLVESYQSNTIEDFKKKFYSIIESGTNLTEYQENGNNIFHQAISKNDIELIKILNLDLGLLNKKNASGNTPFHLAAMTATNTDILKYLLEKGANTSIKTDFDESVFELAQENERLIQGNYSLDFLK